MARSQHGPLFIFPLLILLVILYYLFSISPSFNLGSLIQIPEWIPSSHFGPSPTTLGVFSKIYVVSLPHRTERREQMDQLKRLLGLKWTYFPAVSNESEVVYAVMEKVRTVREDCPDKNKGTLGCIGFSGWRPWPSEEIASLTSSTAVPLNLWNHTFLDPADIPNLSKVWWSSVYSLLDVPLPLTCASRDFDIPPYRPDIKPYRLLTPARIACWHSHLSVIHLIANEDRLGPGQSMLVLEDDVDMELDIQDRLTDLWPSLPREWDIIFLGHCWSNESTSIPLLNPNITTIDTPSHQEYHLYPSHSPKCTHAYALTQTGARRLLLHLQHAPFAYSRAIDQAIAWLIETGRLKGFTIVPSLVAQRKVAESDVMEGTGSRWKDQLRKGALDSSV